MTLATQNDYYQVPGLVYVLCAFPSSYSALFKLGESENGVMVRKTPIIGRVNADRSGGSEGPPAENQFFGMTCDIQLDLSRWDPAQVVKFEKLGGLLSTAGSVPLESVGALLQRDHGIRLLLLCIRDNTLSINMPCTLWSSPQEQGKGTKYAKCGFSITGYRAPEGYWNSASAGIVYDTDLTGVPAELLNE